MFSRIKTLLFLLAMGAMLVLTSCSKDDETAVAKPVINLIEMGLSNSHVAYIGADLHIEADIVAEGKISVIAVEIHQEEGSSQEITAQYTEFAGLKNTTFHKHVDIPSTTVAGTYHCHITVTDMEGNQTTVESEIFIEVLQDTTPPVITIAASPANGATFANGESITISGIATDNIALGGMLIALVYESDQIGDTAVAGDNPKVIVMLHTHDFGADPDEFSFTASIAVGAASDNNMTPAPIQGENAWKTGNYYILVKTKDAMGNWTFSQHYPITINL
ncbi:MAG: DUF4625 domain-containing protein [Bacteroidales bacterium]|nr:DUF4625 domain-containing protein [Bacteroidales bacterium]